uniref:DUF4042 domain-containing protein n=1 Tax=Rodentolepis nana TaxID=102285 RepID=A0A0R3TLM5_RODNA
LVLKQWFLSNDPKKSSSAAHGLQGCLWSLRNIASLYSRIPTSALVKGQLKSIGRPHPTEYLSAPLAGLDALGNANNFYSWSRESLEFFWWSVVRLVCLQLSCRNYQTGKSASSHVMVCTASLECLLEVLSSTPAGSNPTELPTGFQATLRAFCGAKVLTSKSSFLHLDGIDSSFEASDADDESSLTLQSLNLPSSKAVESGSEIVSLVKRNLLPSSFNNTNQIDNKCVALGNPSGPSTETSGETDSEDESAVFATLSMHGCLGLFAERFGLIPGINVSARASAQSLAVACLAKLTLALPRAFLEPLRDEEGSRESCTGVEIALHLIRHSDPQVRGNACLLIGNLLRSTVTHALVDPSLEVNTHLRKEIFRLMNCLDDLLTSEKSGITFRMGLKAIRYCANAVLHLPALVHKVTMETQQPDASICLVECLSSHLVDCTRHPYRLVRREIMLLISDLDWDQFEHLERVWFGIRRKGISKRLVTATPLSKIAWNECVRLFADADRSLGKAAFRALLALARRTPSVDLNTTALNNVDLESIDAVAASLFEHSALTGKQSCTWF